ncbi:hypothetical protein JOQ06_009005 [Pogonophryne albipinna]|uniref:SET domain-containing protein n=1 Tax=Pogonophryne albipinna TaxID=1090488 RepID=A0AAD6BRE9_9TELE|nr:hypothetical protein JOQ06_009005 [Pogonophryne albipinna]
MQRRRRINPKDDATFYIDTGGDKAGLDVQYINAIKGRGIFTSIPFQKGDFLIEYRGELISKQECERRLKLYPVRLKCSCSISILMENCGASMQQKRMSLLEDL